MVLCLTGKRPEYFEQPQWSTDIDFARHRSSLGGVIIPSSQPLKAEERGLDFNFW
jgi:hypothetical protein